MDRQAGTNDDVHDQRVTSRRTESAEELPTWHRWGSSTVWQNQTHFEYAVRHLAASQLVQGSDGKPKVLINTTCPGMCKSDLGRNVAQGSFLVRIVQWLINAIVARTAADGANTYTTALERGAETHGQMWKNDRVFEPGPMMTTPEGNQFGEKTWQEVVQIMLKADASTKAFLS